MTPYESPGANKLADNNYVQALRSFFNNQLQYDNYYQLECYSMWYARSEAFWGIIFKAWISYSIVN